jgi:beta-lactamase regulating signal transducer with metallopeptidase domain
MMPLSSWLTADSVQTVGWVLVHFLWQGAALASILYLTLIFCRTASSRYIAALGTLFLMMMCPCMTFLLLARQPVSNSQEPVIQKAATAIQATISSHTQTLNPQPSNWLTTLVLVWLAGVLLFSARAAGGCLLLERLRRQSTDLAEDLLKKCVALQERLGLGRRIRYVQSDLVDTPSAVGWLRPMVLLPLTAITGLSPQQLEAVIVHELEHIRRFDYLVNLAQIAGETLLFYHPAIWWVNRRIRAEREHCCDDAAVAICGDAVEYAKALTAMEQWRVAPALVLAANGGSLKTRVSRLLGISSLKAGAPRASAALACLVCAATVLFAGTRITGTFTHSSLAGYGEQEASQTEPEPTPSSRPQPDVNAYLVPAPKISEPVARPLASPTPMAEPEISPVPVSPVLAQNAVPRPAPRPAESSSERDQSTATGSYLGELESLGYKDMSADQVIALKIQGVTPQYIRDMRAAGLKPDLNDLIAMKIQGVTPAYVREVHAKGLQPSSQELVAMRIQGVTPAYIDKFKGKGLNDASIDQLIALRVQNVDPAEAAEYKQLGMGDVSLNNLIALHVQNVKPAYIRAMQAAGFNSSKADDYIAAKAVGITPAFVHQVRGHGLKNLTPARIIELKATGVF